MTVAEEAEWHPLVSFEDQSPSYVHGFEAGMIWQRMQDGEIEIEAIVHVENVRTLQAMADAAGYDFDAASTETPGWDSARFVRRFHGLEQARPLNPADRHMHAVGHPGLSLS